MGGEQMDANPGWAKIDITKEKEALARLAREKGYDIYDDRFLNGTYTVRLRKQGSIELSGEGKTLQDAYINALSLLNESK